MPSAQGSRFRSWARSSTGVHVVCGTTIVVVAIATIVVASATGVDPLREVGDALLGLGLGIIGTGLLTVADLTNQLASLSKQLEGTGQDVRSGREPILAAAVRAGTAFVTVGSPPGSADARYLKIVDELESSADANDFSEITAGLRVRHGEDVSESFLLGRQLALILLPKDGNVSDETRAQVKERLSARGVDEDLIKAVDDVLRDAHGMDEPALRRHLRYVGTLLAYVSESMLTPTAKAARSQLLRGTADVEQADPDDSEPDNEFASLIKSLVKAGVHNRDAEVLLFLGVLSDDPEVMERAMAMGADTTVTDVQLMRRYRDWTPASEAQQTTE